MPEHQVGPVRSMVERISYRYVPSLGELLEAADALDAQLAYEKREAERAAYCLGWRDRDRQIPLLVDEYYPALADPSNTRYVVTVKGQKWEYLRTERKWLSDDGLLFGVPFTAETPAEYRAIADCVERAERYAEVTA
jgi:hypothetical protein